MDKFQHKYFTLLTIMFLMVMNIAIGQEKKEAKKEVKQEETSNSLRGLLKDYVTTLNQEEEEEQKKEEKVEGTVKTPENSRTEKLKEEVQKPNLAVDENEDAEEKVLENQLDYEDPPILVQEHKPFIDTLKMKDRLRVMKTNKIKGDFSESEWQKKMNLGSKKSLEGDFLLKDDIEVFGWHPYWMGKGYQSYNFSLLTSIAYFSYEVNPVTGLYHTIHDWETTALIDSARLYDCKVLLTVTNFGYNNNRTFLKNRNNQQEILINELITLLTLRNADGVNIDFENVPKEYKNEFTNFVIDLSNTLKKNNPKFKVTLTIPPKDFTGAFDMQNLSHYVDQFIIMGYEFYGQNSLVAGPMAPIESGDYWWEFNVERSILEYQVDGVATDKLILASPLYGAEWITEDLTYPSKVKGFAGYLTNKQIRNKIGHTPIQRDPTSGSAYYVYRDEVGTYRQLWFEDSVSLQGKIDLIQKHKIKGIGFWALGYANGSPDVWLKIKDNFTVQDADGANAALSMSSFRRYLFYGMRILKNPKSLLSNPRMLFYLFSGVFGINMLFLSTFMAFRYQLTKRIKVATSTFIILGFIIAMGLFLMNYDVASGKDIALLIGGVLIGGLTLFFLGYRFFVRKELP